MNSCNSLIDSASQHKEDSCESHVALYYEQNQEEEISEHYPLDSSCSSTEKIPSVLPPVEIHDENTTNIDLPPLSWHGYHHRSKMLTVTNTGRTIIINGCWANSRPYIEGGPLNGTYLFSQIHFHCPSEHEIDGKRYPLEMHIVHYKTSYLTQERAMNEKDGTVVLVYLFKLMDTCETVMSQITKLAPQLASVNCPLEINDISLFEFIKPFNSNYYIYWGSVITKKKCYALQWIISCSTLGVTKKEAEDLSSIITCAIGVQNIRQTPRVKPENDAVYRVGEENFATVLVEDVCSMCRLYEGDPSRVLISGCTSGTEVYTRNCRRHKSHRFCCRCKLIEADSSNRSELWRGRSPVHFSRSTNHRRKARKNPKFSEPPADGSDGKPVLNCESANGSSASSLCDEKPHKKKKSKNKKYITKKASDYESRKSNSKSSTSGGKSKSKPESSDTGESDGIIDSELKIIAKAKEKLKKGKKKKDVNYQQSQTESDRESEKGNSDSAGEKKEKKTLKKKKEVEIINLLEVSPSKRTLKANTELNNPILSSNDLLSLSPKLSAQNLGANEGRRKNSQGSEIKILASNESVGKPSSEHIDEEKKKSSPSEVVSPESSRKPRSVKSRSKSRTNLQKLKSPESLGKTEGKTEEARPSKSKSPVTDVFLSKKGSMRRDSERSRGSNSKSKVSMRDGSQSKTEKNKKDTELNASQNAQEVKGQITESAAVTENLKHDPKSPEDMKKSNNKLPNNGSSKLEMSKSREGRKSKNKGNNSGQKNKDDSKDSIRTLFEKKQDRKGESLVGECNNVQVNFLLTPDSNTKSIPSCVLTTSESDFTVDKKACKDMMVKKSSLAQNFTVRKATTTESEFPKSKPNEPSHVCLLMEHLLRTENKGPNVWKCSSQEYHVAIIYDQNIMQEYKGKFHPQELQLGSHEVLQLVPKYPESENSNFQLQDCSVKKESLDQICITVKFLVKELSIRQIFAKMENGLSESSAKKEKLLLDEETQCSIKEFDLTESHRGSEHLKENQNNKNKIVDCGISESRSKSKEKQNKPKKNVLLNGEREVEKSRKSTLKLQNDLDVYSKDVSKYSVNEESFTESDPNKQKNKSEATCSEQNDKKLKPLFVKRRKTVYFMYDKVEKDESTGKKVFVGSFRTKEEVNDLKNQKLLQENEGPGKSKEILRWFKNEEDLDVNKSDDPPKPNLLRKQSSPNRTQDVVTLHKYKPKYSDTTRLKREGKNVFIGKVVNSGHKDDETFKNSAETSATGKEEASKISVCDLQAAPESECQKKNSDPENIKRNNKSKAVSPVQTEDRQVQPNTEVIVPETSNEAEKDSANTQKSSNKKEFQTALILLPVEAESLSKTEMIMVENLNNLNQSKNEDEYIPRFKCNK